MPRMDCSFPDWVKLVLADGTARDRTKSDGRIVWAKSRCSRVVERLTQGFCQNRHAIDVAQFPLIRAKT